MKAAQLLEQLSVWAESRPVQLVVLFGSQATGKTHARSDVDVAVWPEKGLAPLIKLTWIDELETLLGGDVSLVLVTPDLNPTLGMEIVRHGRLAFERVPDLWPEKRLQLWHAYNDSLPFRRALRRQLREFAEEVRRGT